MSGAIGRGEINARAIVGDATGFGRIRKVFEIVHGGQRSEKGRRREEEGRHGDDAL